MMIDVQDLEGVRVYDHGERFIGRVYDLFVDDKTNRPEWLVVDSSGVNPDRIIPIVGVQEFEDGIKVPFTQRVIDEAPKVNWTYGLSEQEERRLYEHYGLAYGTCSGSEQPCSDSILPRDASAGTISGSDGRQLGPEMTDRERSDSYRLVLMRRAVGRVPHAAGENVIGEDVA